MPCGCSSNCGCSIIAGAGNITVVRIGDTFTISVSDSGFVQSVSDTDCISLAVDGFGDLTASPIFDPTTNGIILSCNAAGLAATLLIDPASTAPVSIGPSGLLVDCCLGAGALTGVDDTDTVQLTNSLGIVTADVIPNINAGIENQAGGVSIKLQNDPANIIAPCGNRLRFTGVGDLTLLQDGIQTSSIPAGAQVFINGTAGSLGGVSSSILFTNNDTCPVYVLFEGQGFVECQSTGASITNRQISQQMQLNATLLTGGAVSVAGNGLSSFSDFGYTSGNTAIPSSIKYRHLSRLSKWVFMPSGATVTMVATILALENVNGWATAPAGGGFFQIVNYKKTVFPERIGGWLVS